MMLSGNFFAAFGAAPNLALNLLSVLYLVGSVCVYLLLISQISTGIRNRSIADAPERTFGFPEAILASVLILFFLMTISSAVQDPSIQFNPRNLLANLLLTAFVVLVIVTLLQFRGFDVGALAGFFRVGFFRALGTGTMLLFFAYPLIGLSEAVNQRFFGGDTSKQSIVEFFSRGTANDHCFRGRHRSGCRGVCFSVFHLWRNQTLLWLGRRRDSQRGPVRCGPRTFSVVCAVVGSGKLFRHCVRMERLPACLNDNAFAF